MQSQNKHSLALTRQYVQYSADGKGRDLYISSNSGGFSKKYSHGLELRETFPAKIKYKFSNPELHSAPLVYRSDGSGRDSYILRESGGLREEVKSLNAFQLKDILRTPTEHILKYVENKHQKNISWVGKKEFEINKRNSSIKKNVVKRLYSESLPDYKKKLERSNLANNTYDEELSDNVNKYPFNKTLNDLKSYDFNYFLKDKRFNSLSKTKSSSHFKNVVIPDRKNNNSRFSHYNIPNLSKDYQSKILYYDYINKNICHEVGNTKIQNLPNYIHKVKTYDDPLMQVNEYLKRKEIFG